MRRAGKSGSGGTGLNLLRGSRRRVGIAGARVPAPALMRARARGRQQDQEARGTGCNYERSRGHARWLSAGRAPVESSRLRFSETPPRGPTHGPLYGEHNDFVLREILGMADEEIIELVASGALE